MSESQANRPDRLPQDRQPTLRVLPMPADTNAAGDIFGGWLMSQVDVAGSIEAHRRAGGRVVTVAVNEFRFLKPVFVGDVVSFYTKIIRVGSTSIRVLIEAYAERRRGIAECHRVTEAEITYVAIDENRRPTPVDQVP